MRIIRQMGSEGPGGAAPALVQDHELDLDGLGDADADDAADEETLRRMSAVQTVLDNNAKNAYANMNSAKRLTKELLSIYESQTYVVGRTCVWVCGCVLRACL